MNRTDIERIDVFDDDWIDHVWNVDRYRRRNALPLTEKYWALVCDVADELVELPAKGQRSEWDPIALNEAMSKARAVYDAYRLKLQDLKVWLSANVSEDDS